MNNHLEPVFNILLPGIEKAGINYWVYGGLSVAAFAGQFIRKNIDVDIFVKEVDFENVQVILERLCHEHDFQYWPQKQKKWRPKLYIGVKGKERLSVVTVKESDKGVKHLYGSTAKVYSSQILSLVERKIDCFRFFTTTDQYIKEMFKDYLKLRQGKPRQETKEKIKCGAKIILTEEEFKEFSEDRKWI